MEIEIEDVEKEEIEKKKVNKKQYLYALGVIMIAGLFLGSVTHIPIGAQFLVPSLNSVSYFFGTEKQITIPHAVTYYFWHGHWPGYYDWLQCLIGFGLSYAVSAAIATALAAAGVITWAVVAGILSATGVGISLAGALVAF